MRMPRSSRAFGGDAARNSHSAAHEIGGDGGEIVVRRRLPSRRPAWCQRAPNSPPPRMLATTLVPPRSSQSLPMASCRRASRNLEAPVAVEMDRCVARLAGRSHLHVRDAFAVDGNGLVARDHESVGREGARRALEQDGVLAALQMQHGRRRERILDLGQEVAVALGLLDIEASDIDDADVRQAGQARPRPTAPRGREDLMDRPQLVEYRQHQAARRPKEMLRRLARTRLEQDCEVAIAGEEGRQRDAEHGVRGIGFPARRPGRARLQGEPAPVRLHPDIRGQVQFRLRAGAIAPPDVGIEEADALVEPDGFRRLGAVDDRSDAHALGHRLEQHRRLRDIGAAPPQPHGPGVAGAGRHALAVGARQEQRVPVEPFDAALRFRQVESIGHEGLGADLELSQHGGVAAAARQAEDGAVVRARQGRGAGPDPVFIFACRKRVEIENDLPLWPLGLEALQRRASPQAARVAGVLPEIVEVPSRRATNGMLSGRS